MGHRNRKERPNDSRERVTVSFIFLYLSVFVCIFDGQLETSGEKSEGRQKKGGTTNRGTGRGLIWEIKTQDTW